MNLNNMPRLLDHIHKGHAVSVTNDDLLMMEDFLSNEDWQDIRVANDHDGGLVAWTVGTPPDYKEELVDAGFVRTWARPGTCTL